MFCRFKKFLKTSTLKVRGQRLRVPKCLEKDSYDGKNSKTLPEFNKDTENDGFGTCHLFSNSLFWVWYVNFEGSNPWTLESRNHSKKRECPYTNCITLGSFRVVLYHMNHMISK